MVLEVLDERDREMFICEDQSDEQILFEAGHQHKWRISTAPMACTEELDLGPIEARLRSKRCFLPVRDLIEAPVAVLNYMAMICEQPRSAPSPQFDDDGQDEPFEPPLQRPPPPLHLPADVVRDLRAGGMLTDEVINAFQSLIRWQFPHMHGLNPVAEGDAFGVGFEAVSFEQVQVHHVGNIHWVISFCRNGVVIVYDSIRPVCKAEVFKKQLVDLYRNAANPAGCITVKFPKIQRQSGGLDCGLFALANLTAIAFYDVSSEYNKITAYYLCYVILICFCTGILGPTETYVPAAEIEEASSWNSRAS